MNTKWKVISSVMLLIMIICAVFIFLMLKNRKTDLDRFIAEQVKSARIVAQIIEDQKSNQYKKRIRSLVNFKSRTAHENLIQAFARRDRNELAHLSSPFFEVFKKESVHFSTFGWVLPDNHAFFRVHNPKKFGEDVSVMRPDIVAANKDHKQHAGFTTGYMGLQYRIVQPVSYNNQHIGTIQFGVQDSFILDPIQDKLHLPVGLVMPNEKFKYIKRSKLLNLPGTTHTIQGRDLSLFAGKEEVLDWSMSQQRLQLQGKEYVVVKVLELRNFKGQAQGDVFVALDISAEISKMQTLMWTTLSLSLIILVISFVILYSSYGALIQKIVNLNSSLEQSNRKLEDRVKERTEKLLSEIEERKIAEKNRAIAEGKAQRTNKMEAIGLMAGGVAHDLNNILSGIVSYPELLLMQLPADSEMRKPLESIQDSGRRAATVVADLLTVARGVASDRHTTNLNDLVHEYFNSPECEKIKGDYPFVHCSLDCDAEIFNISCSPVHIKKCLMNLVNNGLEAVKNDGAIVISTRNQYVDKPVSGNQYLKTGEYVVLTVTDNGAGIAKEDIEHIFEPFYTKKKMGRSGTGLGLAIVWNTVNDHKGAVTITSGNDGTIFELYFPGVRGDVVNLAENVDLTDLQGNGQMILVVDDEKQQREIASQMLEALGYEVDSVGSGEEAVEYVTHVRQVDLVVLDMVMDPGMGGRQTYEQIIARSPGQKAIIASGFSETQDVTRALDLGVGLFVRKPYTMYQFGLAVKQVLERE